MDLKQTFTAPQLRAKALMWEAYSDDTPETVAMLNFAARMADAAEGFLIPEPVWTEACHIFYSLWESETSTFAECLRGALDHVLKLYFTGAFNYAERIEPQSPSDGRGAGPVAQDRGAAGGKDTGEARGDHDGGHPTPTA